MFLSLGKWKTVKGFVQRGSKGQVRVTHKESGLEVGEQRDIQGETKSSETNTGSDFRSYPI